MTNLRQKASRSYSNSEVGGARSRLAMRSIHGEGWRFRGFGAATSDMSIRGFTHSGGGIAVEKYLLDRAGLMEGFDNEGVLHRPWRCRQGKGF